MMCNANFSDFFFFKVDKFDLFDIYILCLCFNCSFIFLVSSIIIFSIFFQIIKDITFNSNVLSGKIKIVFQAEKVMYSTATPILEEVVVSKSSKKKGNSKKKTMPSVVEGEEEAEGEEEIEREEKSIEGKIEDDNEREIDGEEGEDESEGQDENDGVKDGDQKFFGEIDVGNKERRKEMTKSRENDQEEGESKLLDMVQPLHKASNINNDMKHKHHLVSRDGYDGGDKEEDRDGGDRYGDGYLEEPSVLTMDPFLTDDFENQLEYISK